MRKVKFNTTAIEDGILLVSGAGDGDTGGGLYAVDGKDSKLIDRVSSAGITLFDNRLARLLRTPLHTGGGEILVYDKRGVSNYLRVDELSDPHYLMWDGQHLIVSSTGTNSLLWVTLGGEIVRRWRAPGEGDSWHLNDVHLARGRLYACAFGRFEHYRGYKDYLFRGDGFVFDVSTGRSVVEGLCAPHSPRYFDGVWTVCDSLRNSVVQVDSNGNRIREAKLRAFTRGLAVTDDYVIVGESAQRASGDGAATGSLAILRRSDFSFVERLEVPFREVSEVVVAPRFLCDAVSTGFKTNPLRVSESDQLHMFRDVGIEPKRLWAVSERLVPDQCKIRIEAQIPATFIAGKPAQVECTLENLSEVFLCSELPFPVCLSYKWKNALDSTPLVADDGNRTRLPGILPPGATINFRVDVQAPEEEGEFEILMTLVQEYVLWFDSVNSSNAYRATARVVQGESMELRAATAD